MESRYCTLVVVVVVVDNPSCCGSHSVQLVGTVDHVMHKKKSSHLDCSSLDGLLYGSQSCCYCAGNVVGLSFDTSDCRSY